MRESYFGKFAAGIAAIVTAVAPTAVRAQNAAGRPQVAAYYFPNYHPGDARNAKVFGPAWSEWDLVKAARPRFPGHHEPNVPAWGYEDEADPAVMARKIDAAADHGVDAFVFDWYYYDDGAFLDDALEKGYLKGRE